jgi:hypothetical protein
MKRRPLINKQQTAFHPDSCSIFERRRSVFPITYACEIELLISSPSEVAIDECRIRLGRGHWHRRWNTGLGCGVRSNPLAATPLFRTSLASCWRRDRILVDPQPECFSSSRSSAEVTARLFVGRYFPSSRRVQILTTTLVHSRRSFALQQLPKIGNCRRAKTTR